MLQVSRGCSHHHSLSRRRAAFGRDTTLRCRRGRFDPEFGAVLQCFVFDEGEGEDGIGISYPQAALIRAALRKVLACDTLRYRFRVVTSIYRTPYRYILIYHMPGTWEPQVHKTEGRNVFSLTMPSSRAAKHRLAIHYSIVTNMCQIKMGRIPPPATHTALAEADRLHVSVLNPNPGQLSRSIAFPEVARYQYNISTDGTTSPPAPPQARPTPYCPLTG